MATIKELEQRIAALEAKGRRKRKANPNQEIEEIKKLLTEILAKPNPAPIVITQPAPSTPWIYPTYPPNYLQPLTPWQELSKGNTWCSGGVGGVKTLLDIVSTGTLTVGSGYNIQ